MYLYIFHFVYIYIYLYIYIYIHFVLIYFLGIYIYIYINRFIYINIYLYWNIFIYIPDLYIYIYIEYIIYTYIHMFRLSPHAVIAVTKIPSHALVLALQMGSGLLQVDIKSSMLTCRWFETLLSSPDQQLARGSSGESAGHVWHLPSISGRNGYVGTCFSMSRLNFAG